MTLINSELQIYEFDLDIPFEESVYQQLIEDHHHHLKHSAIYKKTIYNFPMQHTTLTGKLYDYFLNVSLSIFQKITLLPENSGVCHAQISNKHDTYQDKAIHNHHNTAVINSVFYYSIPDINTGKLVFCDEHLNPLHIYQPTAGKILIFPADIYHYPELCDSERYRIAINMEIICKEDVWDRKHKFSRLRDCLKDRTPTKIW